MNSAIYLAGFLIDKWTFCVQQFFRPKTISKVAIILDRIKWNSGYRPPQIKDEAAQKAKRVIFRQLSVKMWANLTNSFREIHYDRNYVCVHWLEAATFLSHAHQTETSFSALLSRDFDKFWGQIVFMS